METILLALILQDADRWIEDLGAPEIETRERASRELLRMGSSAAPPLVRALSHVDLEVAARAEQILSDLSLELPEDLVARYPAIQNLSVRREVLELLRAMNGEALGSLGHGQSPRELLVHFPKYRRLVEIGRPAVPALLRTVGSESAKVEVRYFLLLILGEIGDERALPALIDLLGSTAQFSYSAG